jgi:hypothetical protein
MNTAISSQKNKYVLVGFAVDVSGSMQESIRNEKSKKENRFDGFRESLKQLSQEAKKEIEINKEKGSSASIDVFAYAFGLKDLDYCDLLTLIKFGQEMTFNQTKKGNTSQRTYSDPYGELEDIAKKNGIQDIPGFKTWIMKALPRSEEAQRLAERLHQYPQIAKHITQFLPKNIGEAALSTSSYWAEKTIPGLGNYIANAVDPTGNRNNLNKAESLAREFANASDDEVRKIIIREVGNLLEKELSERGNTTMPLEKVVDLLNSREDELEDIESLIYGNTPMQSALKAVKSRFEKELRDLPKDTIPILFIISDGIPTDGNPMWVAQALKTTGVHIVSCFVTNQDIIHPRKLFNTAEAGWNDGARLMFNMASPIEKNSDFTRFLVEIGWTVPSNAQLFVQVNHTDVLDEFIRVVLSPIKESQ